MNKLAIVIPFYNIDFFEETLKSVANQTNKGFTLYIGNDASPNDPSPLIEKYFAQENYKYYNYKTNLGGENLVKHWERILENTTEEWFQILGDDDTIAEDFVAEFYNSLARLNEEQINVLKYPINIVDAKSNFIKKSSFSTDILDRKSFIMSRICHSSLSSLSENIFRTAGFQKFKFRHLPLAWHSDDLLIFEVAENNKILYNNTSYVNVRSSGINISSKSDNLKTKALATSEFYKCIILNYYTLFTSNQKEEILNNLKKHYYNSKQKVNLDILFEVLKDNVSRGLKLTKYLF
ncbi:glycosyltransferase family 2 protein [Chryseobacterium sp. FH1]|uniref:glycosyltransferase family 2 protein n=1 Tax=Chryseobacterium sp. FH1 TaxID=1233951 RepID=UPI00068B3CC9|nr:glycosyltransferase family 2 protein [Chryseobacterium sp. FH1]